MPTRKNSQDFISLQEAVRYCDYSQDYLSLRARQRKLKAKKIGRNWMTKKNWVKDYVLKVSNQKKERVKSKSLNKKKPELKKANQKKERVKSKSFNKKRPELKKISQKKNKIKKKLLKNKNTKKENKIINVPKKIKVEEKSQKAHVCAQAPPPENIPIGKLKIKKVDPLYYKLLNSPLFCLALTTVILFLIVTTIFLSFPKKILETCLTIRDGFEVASEEVHSFVKTPFVKIAEDTSSFLYFIDSKISKNEIYSAAIYDTVDIFKDYGNWLFVESSLGRGIDFTRQKYFLADNHLNDSYSNLGDKILSANNFTIIFLEERGYYFVGLMKDATGYFLEKIK